MPTLEITTMVGCPLKCTFCPQDQLRSTYGNREKYLSLDRFQAILAKVPKHVRIDFSGMAEPWANPHATAMLMHALMEGYNVAVYTTLYGMEKPEAVVNILKAYAAQVETVVLHLPDRNGNMRGFRMSEEYGRALGLFIALKESGVMRHVEMMTMDPDGGLHVDLSESPALAPWVGNDRAGALDIAEIGAQPVEEVRHDGPVSCAFTPFYDQNVLLPNGDVVLCCMDYSVRHRIGNLVESEYYEIFAGEPLARLRAENMRIHSSGAICKNCTRARSYHQREGHRQFWKSAQDRIEAV